MKPIFLAFCLLFSSVFVTNAQEILSPNKKIKVVISTEKALDKSSFGQVYFKVFYRNQLEYIEVMPNSPMGIVRNDQEFTDNLKFVAASKARKIEDKYEMLSGKQKLCSNLGTEKILKYVNSNGKPLNIVFRVYNNGVAFLYEFPDAVDSPVNIIDETTTYVFPSTTNRWLQAYTESYEDFYPFSENGGTTNKKQEWGFPSLFKVNDNPVWVLISEANIAENNCASKLSNLNNPNEYKVSYASPRDNFKQTGVQTMLPWKSQWHTLVGNFKLQLIKDGADDKSFAAETIKVKKGDSLNIDCLARGGFVAVLEK